MVEDVTREAGRMDAGGLSIAAVIPTYNRARLLGRAIESVLAQSRSPDEILVVDDGSTEDVASTVRRYGNLVELVRKPRGGIASARNLAASLAETDFIAFLDSDDYWDGSHLDAVARAIAGTEQRASLYFCDVRLSKERGGGTLWERCGFSIADPYELKADAFPWLMMRRQPMMIQASVIGRSLYLSVGGSAERLVRRSDTHLLFKLGLSGPICAVAAVGGEVTSDDPRSLTFSYASNDPTYLDCTLWLYQDVLARVRQRSRGERSLVADVSRTHTGGWLARRLSAPSGPRGISRRRFGTSPALFRGEHGAWQSASERHMNTGQARQVSP